MDHSELEQLSASEAARLLGVSADRVRQLSRRGGLRYTDSPLGRLYARADVQALADARQLASTTNVEAGRD